MRLSILLLESSIDLDQDRILKLKSYFDNKEDPKEVCYFTENIIEGGSTYSVYRIAKKLKKSIQTYDIDNSNKIIPTEKEILSWDSCFVYIKNNSKYIYVKGAGAGWTANLLSKMMFEDDSKITFRTIQADKIEEDIRKNAKFTSSGTSFFDSDGTKITISNPAGIDLEEHYVTNSKKDVSKEHIDIIVEKDDLRFNVMIYSLGKVTFYGYIQEPHKALRIFLKIWSEIKDYC